MTKKSHIAEELYSLFSTTIDLWKDGLYSSYTTPDFSQLDDESFNKDTGTTKNNPDKSNLELELKKNKMIDIAEKIMNCSKCPLSQDARQIIPGIGNVNASIMVIIDPPQINEERIGRPLLGEELEFFKKWLNAIQISEEDLFFVNIVRCVPRQKLKKEFVEACYSHLNKQLEIINPLLILSIGQIALSSLRKMHTDLTSYHGQIFYYNEYPLIPTWHPRDVLSNPQLKKLVWEDLKKFQVFLKGKMADEEDR